jgi:folate-binding protein YgfZ
MLAAALTAQGRVEGLFSVYCVAEADFILVCEGGERPDVISAFSRYIVADRVVVEDVTDAWVVCHVAEASRCTDHGSPVVREAIFLPRTRISPTGVDLVIPRSSEQELYAALSTSGDELTAEQFALRRLKFGDPSFPAEVNTDVVLTECGLYDHVSFTKGCYVGQEVIERSDAIGKLPRKLQRIALGGVTAVTSGVQVTNSDGGEIGKVLTCLLDSDSSQALCFALLRNGRCSVGDTVKVGELSGMILGEEKL